MLKRKFNLHHIFEQIMALYVAKAKEKNIQCTLTIDSKIPKTILGDKIRIHRIALELIENALNFTLQGHIAIQLLLAEKKGHDFMLQLIVQDSGIGIPKDRLDALQKGQKNEGVGLSVVHQFIDELQGSFSINSEPLKGTCCTCFIPMQEAFVDSESTPEMSVDKPRLMVQFPTIEAKTQGGPLSRILLIEDNRIALMATQTILSSIDCLVDVALNGEDAVSLCKKNHYDLIFMDIGLGPGMDGFEATRHIRTLNKTPYHSPIVALTAHASDEHKKRCIEAGMDAVLTKPLTKSQAIDILTTFIPERGPQQQELTLRRQLPDDDSDLFQLEQFSLLDSEQALNNFSDKALLFELLTLMITKELPADLKQMKEAFILKDYAAVEAIAHKIKASAIYLGTTRMKYACQYLERYWKTGQRVLFERLYNQTINTIEDTCVHVASWLKGYCNI